MTAPTDDADAQHHLAIIAGLIIGLLVKLVVPGRQAIPLWLTNGLGIVGALMWMRRGTGPSV